MSRLLQDTAAKRASDWLCANGFMQAAHAAEIGYRCQDSTRCTVHEVHAVMHHYCADVTPAPILTSSLNKNFYGWKVKAKANFQDVNSHPLKEIPLKIVLKPTYKLPTSPWQALMATARPIIITTTAKIPTARARDERLKSHFPRQKMAAMSCRTQKSSMSL